MSRTMPYECPHGVILDWGDFGGSNSERGTCALCDDTNEAAFARRILDALTAYGPGLRTDDEGAIALFVARHIRSDIAGPETVRCPSPSAGGREDRCGLFSYPPRCAPGRCTASDIAGSEAAKP